MPSALCALPASNRQMPLTRRPLRIAFYAPFKPLDHPHPSGDLVTASGIFDFLVQCGHQVYPASHLRCRWIYWKPWLWLKMIWEKRQVAQQFSDTSVDLWLTYHSYYNLHFALVKRNFRNYASYANYCSNLLILQRIKKSRHCPLIVL